jgi:hypothetical protein
MVSELLIIADIVSAAAAFTLGYSTIEPCRLSGVKYLLGVPAGFALIGIGFLLGFPTWTGVSGSTIGFATVSLLTQTYGLLFVALTYARRTRLRLIGESVILEILIPVLVTIGAVTYAVISQGSGASEVFRVLDTPLRAVMILSILYLVYETTRNWSYTQRASEGVVTVAFIFLLIEQLGFLLVAENLGDVATFVGYEGRLLGLFILTAITVVKVREGDHRTVLRRLGLTALAH